MATSYRRTIDSCVLAKIISLRQGLLNYNYAGAEADLHFGARNELPSSPGCLWMSSEHQGEDSQRVYCVNLYFEIVKAPRIDDRLYTLGFDLCVPRGRPGAR